MPTVDKVARTNAGLASELRNSVMRLRRRLANERHPDNELSLGAMAVLGALYRIVHEDPPRLEGVGPMAALLEATMVIDPAARWSMPATRSMSDRARSR